MKKVYVMFALFAMAAVFALALGITSSEAAPEVGQTPYNPEVAISDLTPAPQPMSECTTIKCGTCPGPGCKIDGICCYVPGNSAKAGLAHCGCDANGNPVCECQVGVPR